MVELAEDEMLNFGKVCALAFVSLTYCFVIGKLMSKGVVRLLAIFPVITIFLMLPLNLTSAVFCGMTAFFISWLANFKLLLFAYGKPPLCLNQNQSVTFLQFLALASFPISIIPDEKEPKLASPAEKSHAQAPWNYCYTIKGAVVIVLFWILVHHSNKIHRNLTLPIYMTLIYFCLEIMLGCVASVTKIILGQESQPHFNDPLSSTSLQDFWGKRWNLMVTNILRPTVYLPSKYIFTRIIGRKFATYPAVMITFIVSAIMHELIIYYLGRTAPTFEAAWFFVMHGFVVCIEIAAKKLAAGKWDCKQRISGPATLLFVAVTMYLLFLPPLLRTVFSSKMLDEFAAVFKFMSLVL